MNRAAVVFAWALLLSAAGCGSGTTTTADAGAPGAAGPALSATQVLERLTKAYHDAISYEDGGEVYFTFFENGREATEGPAPYSTALSRPNKIRLHLFQAMIVGDGTKLFAATNDIPRQVLEIKSPTQLTPSNVAESEILRHAMNGGLPMFESPILDLLLGDAPLKHDLAGGPPKLLSDEKIDGRPCWRVELTTADGPKVLWVEKESFILRRVELPTAQLKKQLDPENQLERIAARIELKGARLDPELKPAVFEFEVPQGAARVQRFVPLIAAPPQRIGELLPAFAFEDLKGRPVTSASMGGKVRLLDFWFTTCGPCAESMPRLQKLYEKYEDNPDVKFFAVSIDPKNVSSQDIRKTLRGWGADVPILRDNGDVAQKVFQVEVAPTLFLLDAANKVHAYQMGAVPSYADIEQRIEMLLAGEDVSKQVLANYEAEKEAFELELQKASSGAGEQLIEVPRAEIAPRNRPTNVKLTRLWRDEEVEEPGNLLIVEQKDGPPRIFVLDGWRTVVELDAEGKVVARHDLPIPPRTGVSFLRTAVDKQGKRYFIAAAVSQQQLHLFDENWKHLLSFPEGAHAGIADVQLGDLDANGELELLVGYWDNVGVQGVNLQGKRLWSNRGMQNVMQVALGDPDRRGARKAICVNSRGTLVPVDNRGEADQDIRVLNRALTNLVVSDLDSDGKSEWCAIAADPRKLGKFVAVGVAPDGKELWHYDLPEGLHKYLVERIVPGPLSAGDGGWLLPAADGSVHLLTKNGQLVDRFNTGKPLTGLALARFPEGPVLLISSPEGLTAYRIEPRTR